MRPRLAIPGLVELSPTYVGQEHRIIFGALAGYGLGEDVTNWKNTYTFVALADLSLEDRLRLAPKYAEIWRALADPSGGYRTGEAVAFPHLTALLSHAQLLLVGSTDRRELGPAGHVRLDGPHRVFEIGFMRTADDYFLLRATRGKTLLASVSGGFWSIVDHASVEEDESTHLAERILRAATGGLVDGAQIALAFSMADVAEPASWERHLAAIETRAEPNRVLGGDVVRAIESAPEDADVVELPVYGLARKTTLAARTLRSSASDDSLEAHVEIGGATLLELPVEQLWSVDADVDPLPAMPREIFGTKPSAPHPNARGLLVLVALLVLFALVVWVVARTPR